MSHLNETNELLIYDHFDRQPSVFAFSTTRSGGYSKGNYASFNCTPYCGDNPNHVCDNQRHLCDMLPCSPVSLVIPHQIHGNNVRIIDSDYARASLAERRQTLEGIDGLVTNLRGYCLCVSTADCIPLVFYDACTQAIGVAHAGWRGTVARIATQTLQTMNRTYGSQPENIKVVIGPGISLEAFEVGIEVYEHFRQSAFPMERIARWYKQTEKWHINLWEANRWLLQESGVSDENIELSGICSYRQCDEFFSARRLGIASGRTLTGIMLNNNHHN